MKYWAYLVGKLAVGAGLVFGLHFALLHVLPSQPNSRYGRNLPLFLHDMVYTFAILGVWLVAVGLLSVIIRDQRRRCRTCLRTLIMPVARGSWGNILTIGRPATEWICPYGHGTLRIDELQITGKEPPDWKAHTDDIWKELESYYQAPK